MRIFKIKDKNVKNIDVMAKVGFPLKGLLTASVMLLGFITTPNAYAVPSYVAEVIFFNQVTFNGAIGITDKNQVIGNGHPDSYVGPVYYGSKIIGVEHSGYDQGLTINGSGYVKGIYTDTTVAGLPVIFYGGEDILYGKNSAGQYHEYILNDSNLNRATNGIENSELIEADTGKLVPFKEITDFSYAPSIHFHPDENDQGQRIATVDGVATLYDNGVAYNITDLISNKLDIGVAPSYYGGLSYSITRFYDPIYINNNGWILGQVDLELSDGTSYIKENPYFAILKPVGVPLPSSLALLGLGVGLLGVMGRRAASQSL